jgi:hypothetical protein
MELHRLDADEQLRGHVAVARLGGHQVGHCQLLSGQSTRVEVIPFRGINPQELNSGWHRSRQGTTRKVRKHPGGATAPSPRPRGCWLMQPCSRPDRLDLQPVSRHERPRRPCSHPRASGPCPRRVPERASVRPGQACAAPRVRWVSHEPPAAQLGVGLGHRILQGRRQLDLFHERPQPGAVVVRPTGVGSLDRLQHRGDLLLERSAGDPVGLHGDGEARRHRQVRRGHWAGAAHLPPTSDGCDRSASSNHTTRAEAAPLAAPIDS